MKSNMPSYRIFEEEKLERPLAKIVWFNAFSLFMLPLHLLFAFNLVSKLYKLSRKKVITGITLFAQKRL